MKSYNFTVGGKSLVMIIMITTSVNFFDTKVYEIQIVKTISNRILSVRLAGNATKYIPLFISDVLLQHLQHPLVKFIEAITLITNIKTFSNPTNSDIIAPAVTSYLLHLL